MQNITSLISTQIGSLALQRNQKEEAGIACDAALNERVSGLEEKIQSILQENLQIEKELKEARSLYEEQQQNNKVTKTKILTEIAPLENQVKVLTGLAATLSQKNHNLSTTIDKERAFLNNLLYCRAAGFI